MFTGIIEEVGTIQSLETSPEGCQLTVKADKILEDCLPGHSVAMDGVCTTAVNLTGGSITVELSPETLSKTTFGNLAVGHRINFERPLTPQTRLGGHFVTGHVDGLARVISKVEEGNSWIFHFRLINEDFAPLLIEKGSIAINGISLTVNDVDGPIFSVAIIPFTLEHTNIGDLNPDDLVNIETDILGKYVQKLLPTASTKSNGDSPSNIHTGIWFNLEKAPS